MRFYWKRGKRPSSKRTRAINIRYFFITDQVAKGNVEIRYCPTNVMIGDFFTKPLQGKKFENFRDLILGKMSISSLDRGDRSVLENREETRRKTTDNGQTNLQHEDVENNNKMMMTKCSVSLDNRL